MGLLRLLTAGKSLVGLKDPEARYRMTDPRVLPKFGSEKNPFNRPRKSSSGENRTPIVDPVLPEVPQQPGLCETQRGDETNGLVHSGSLRKSSTLRLPEARSAAAPAAEAKATEHRQGSGSGGQLRSFVKKLKPLLSFRAMKKRAKPIEARPIQGELSLDKVKVMRNDLSDTDFVIVRKKAQPSGEPGFAFAEKSESQPPAPVQNAIVNI